jgi:hypothetical protein
MVCSPTAPWPPFAGLLLRLSRDNLDENGGGDQSLKRRPVAKS